MPIHDWTNVPSGLFHDFHQSWSVRIKDALNAGLLPKGVSALVEQRAGVKEGDILTVERRQKRPRPGDGASSGVQTLERPATRIVRSADVEIYASRANRVVVKHHLGRIIAVIEIVSPGNKDSKLAFKEFVEKIIDFLRGGVHLLVVDLFPPTKRDPCGIHKAIWDEILEEPFNFPEGKDRILASYEIGAKRTAFVEPVAVGDEMRDMPLFLEPAFHVNVPLEPTYRAAWDASPEEMRVAVETGVMPDPDAD